MKPDLFLILNHELTADQKKDAFASLSVQKIIDLTPNLKKLWRTIPHETIKIKAYLKPMMDWLGEKATQKDFVLIQGDFGASYIMVQFALESGLVPVYSTSLRKSVEIETQTDTVEKTGVFKHVLFRRYGC